MSVSPHIRRYEIIPLAAGAARSSIQTPLFSCTAAAGFPSPAEDYLEQPLDFNELLVKNPAATFAVRIAGESMMGAGLFPDDIAVVNRSVTPTNGAVILALLDGEFTVKRYRVRGKHVYLQAENPKFPDIQIHEGAAFEVWGVISHAIRML